MNDNLNIPSNPAPTNAAMAEAHKFLADDATAFDAMLAAKPIDGAIAVSGTDTTVGFITDADETADEPTIH